MKPDWIKETNASDWLIDGRQIRYAEDITLWLALDWTKARIDLGPSPAGNMGPYWHVPKTGGDTVHRLYPKIMKEAKWLLVVRQAILDYNAQELTQATELTRKIHEALKRGEDTRDHGLIMNLRCILDHVIDNDGPT